MKPFDQAWILLKRVGAGQYELGDFDLNFPHTQGPIVRYHGKHETPEMTARIDQEGILPFLDRNNLDNRGRPAGWQSQVGPTAGFQEGDVPDAPLYTSVTRTRDTADAYATGREQGTDKFDRSRIVYRPESGPRAEGEPMRPGTRTPTIYGVRAAALARRQDLDAPTRQLQHNTTAPQRAVHRGEYEFIRDGIKPEELHRFKTTEKEAFVNPSVRREGFEGTPMETVQSELDAFEGPKTDGFHLTGNSPMAVYDRARHASQQGDIDYNALSGDEYARIAGQQIHGQAQAMEAQEQEMMRQWQEQQAMKQQQEAMRQASAQPQPPQGTQTTLGQFNQQGMM